MATQLPSAPSLSRRWLRVLLACAAALALFGAAAPLGAAARLAAGIQAAGQLFVPLVVVPAASKSYYVDCIAGNDSNSGVAE